MPRRAKKIDRRVRYRGLKWNIRAVRPNWLILERGLGLSTWEVVWVPKGCVSPEDLDRALAA